MHVEQEARGTSESVLQTVIKSDLEREYLLSEERAIRAALDGTHTDDTTTTTAASTSPAVAAAADPAVSN